MAVEAGHGNGRLGARQVRPGKPLLPAGHRPRALFDRGRLGRAERPADSRRLQQGTHRARPQREHLERRRAQGGLTAEGSIFQGTADSELLLHAFSRSRKRDREGFLREALEPLEGAYSLAIMHEDALIAVRDPSGFRPLYIGHSGTKTYVASETCALHALMPMDYREVEPGEVVIVDDSGERSFFLEPKRPPKRCVFELIYFARPDSEVFGRSVHAARVLLGEALADQDAGRSRPTSSYRSPTRATSPP
jgi:hypothetical protein